MENNRTEKSLAENRRDALAPKAPEDLISAVAEMVAADAEPALDLASPPSVEAHAAAEALGITPAKAQATLDVLRAYGALPGIPPASPPAPDLEPASAPLRTAAPRGRSPMTLIKKLAEVSGDLGFIEKRGRNAFHNYDYATESDIMAAIRPRLAERSVFVQTLIIDETKKDEGKKSANGKPTFLHRVETLHIFHCGDTGETLDVRGIGYADDGDDKGFFKAYTGAVKYAMAKTFLISSGDDPEAEGAEEKAKGKKAAAAAAQASGGPQRSSSGCEDQGEGVPFFVTCPITEVKTTNLTGGRIRYAFPIPGLPKPASTVHPQIGAKVAKEKGTGLSVRFELIKNGGWVNIQNAEVLPPGTVVE